MKNGRRIEAQSHVGAQLKFKTKDSKRWGDYAEACRLFAEYVKALPGVRAVAAKHCGDYVDLWVFADEAHQIDLIRPVGTALKRVWKRFPRLFFDSFVTRQQVPTNFVVFFEVS